MIYLDNLMTPGVYEKEAKNNRDKAVEALTKTGFVVSQEITVGLEDYNNKFHVGAKEQESDFINSKLGISFINFPPVITLVKPN